MENTNSVIELKSYRIEKQYKDYYITGNLELARDFNFIHKNASNLKEDYTKAWIKLLTNYLHNN